jgi:D-3-phosphoglycerate dehydrogenase
MKVLANDGISKAGEQALKEAGIEILDNRVAQDHVINFINDNNVDVLLGKKCYESKTGSD